VHGAEHETAHYPETQQTREGIMKTVTQGLSERERVFEHIQSGKSPLSNEDIAKLAQKHPKTWTQFIGRGVDK